MLRYSKSYLKGSIVLLLKIFSNCLFFRAPLEVDDTSGFFFTKTLKYLVVIQASKSNSVGDIKTSTSRARKYLCRLTYVKNSLGQIKTLFFKQSFENYSFKCSLANGKIIVWNYFNLYRNFSFIKTLGVHVILQYAYCKINI